MMPSGKEKFEKIQYNRKNFEQACFIYCEASAFFLVFFCKIRNKYSVHNLLTKESIIYIYIKGGKSNENSKRSKNHRATRLLFSCKNHRDTRRS